MIKSKAISTLLTKSLRPQAAYLYVLYTYSQGTLALGRGTGSIQRQIYFFLQKTQLHTSFDAQFHIVQHLPNDSSLQAQVRTSCQENTAVISSTVFRQTHLSFSTYLFVLTNPLLSMSLKDLSDLRYFNLYFFNSLSVIWKKLHSRLSSCIIYG